MNFYSQIKKNGTVNNVINFLFPRVKHYHRMIKISMLFNFRNRESFGKKEERKEKGIISRFYFYASDINNNEYPLIFILAPFLKFHM